MAERPQGVRIRLREALKPRDGSETAVWTGIFVFVLAVVIAGVLIAFGGSGTGDHGHEQASMTAGQDSGPAGPLDPQGVWDPYVAVVGGGRGGSEAAQKQWSAVTRSFVRDFLAASKDPHWLAKVKPLVSPQLLQRLHWVTRTQVPTGTMSGLTLNTAGDHAVDVTATYRSGGAKRALGIGLVDLPGDGRGWMVYSYEDRAPAS